MVADDVLRQGVQGISDLITRPGEVNIDFADVKTVMKGKGDAILGIGKGEGNSRAIDAATEAINNPLLEDSHIEGAKNILVHISCGETLSLAETNEIVDTITETADPDVFIIYGQSVDPAMGDGVAVTVIATEFPGGKSACASPVSSFGEKKSADDDNLVSYNQWETIGHGSKSSSAFDSSSALSASFGSGTSSFARSLRRSSESAAEKPQKSPFPSPSASTARSKEDIEIPACLRTNRISLDND